jgi:serine/threonine protein phosphatase PrpC
MLKEQIYDWLCRSIPSRSSGGTAKDSISLQTDIGSVRTENQDRVACLKMRSRAPGEPSAIVIALSDGMGGMRDGAKCASLAIASFFSTLLENKAGAPTHRLATAAAQANEDVHSFSNGHGGATLSAIFITSDLECTTLNIGDSRIYANYQDNMTSLERLTIDDSLAEAVGGTNRDLIQYIGMGYGLKTNAKRMYTKPKHIILTSDGVHFINERTFFELVYHSQDINQLANRLMTIVRWSGAPDNASLAIISIENLRSTFSEPPHGTFELWDAFSELHFLTFEPQKEKLSDEKNNDCQKDDYAKSLIKTEQDNSEPERIEKLSSPPKTVKKIPRSGQRKKKVIEVKEDLQIVIDMDATRLENTDDNSK